MGKRWGQKKSKVRMRKTRDRHRVKVIADAERALEGSSRRQTREKVRRIRRLARQLNAPVLRSGGGMQLSRTRGT